MTVKYLGVLLVNIQPSDLYAPAVATMMPRAKTLCVLDEKASLFSLGGTPARVHSQHNP